MSELCPPPRPSLMPRASSWSFSRGIPSNAIASQLAPEAGDRPAPARTSREINAKKLQRPPRAPSRAPSLARRKSTSACPFAQVNLTGYGFAHCGIASDSLVKPKVKARFFELWETPRRDTPADEADEEATRKEKHSSIVWRTSHDHDERDLGWIGSDVYTPDDGKRGSMHVQSKELPEDDAAATSAPSPSSQSRPLNATGAAPGLGSYEAAAAAAASAAAADPAKKRRHRSPPVQTVPLAHRAPPPAPPSPHRASPKNHRTAPGTPHTIRVPHSPSSFSSPTTPTTPSTPTSPTTPASPLSPNSRRYDTVQIAFAHEAALTWMLDGYETRYLPRQQHASATDSTPSSPRAHRTPPSSVIPSSSPPSPMVAQRRLCFGGVDSPQAQHQVMFDQYPDQPYSPAPPSHRAAPSRPGRSGSAPSSPASPGSASVVISIDGLPARPPRPNFAWRPIDRTGAEQPSLSRNSRAARSMLHVW